MQKLKLLKKLKVTAMLLLFFSSLSLYGQRTYEINDPNTFDLPTDVPNPVHFGDMIGVNENGLIFWDHVYDSKTGQVVTPMVRNSFMNTFDKIRLFHPIEKDYNVNNGTSNRANNYTIQPCLDPNRDPNRNYFCAMRDFYSVLRPDYNLIASASTSNMYDYPNKWFSYTDWGGAANARDNAYEYAVAFLETMDPQNDPNQILVDRFYVTNESWGTSLTDAQYNDVIDGFIEGFTEYYQGNRYATPNQSSWNIKMWHGAFQAFKPSHVEDYDFVGNMLSTKARNTLQGLDVHPYSFSQTNGSLDISEHPESTNSFFLSVKSMVKWRNDQTDNVQNFGISATEFGWNDEDVPNRIQTAPYVWVVESVNGGPSYQPNNPADWKMQHPGVGQEAQALYTTRAYLMFARYGLESAYIYAAMNNNESIFQNCGVYYADPLIEVLSDGSFKYSNYPNSQDFRHEKMIMPAMRKLADPVIIGNKIYLETLSEDDNGVYAFLVGDAVGQPTHMVAWHAKNINKLSEAQILNQTITRSLSQIGLTATGNTINASANSTRLDWHEGSINNISTSSLLSNANQNLTLTPIPVVIPLNATSNCTSANTVWSQCESFETNFGIFSHVSGTKDWRRKQNNTTSNNTGPSGASSGNYYIYTEASGNGNGYPNKLFALESSCCLLTGYANPALSFDYHMYGTGMGNLKILIGEVGSNSLTTVFDKSGNQGDTWYSTSTDLSSFLGKNIYIRIEGTTASNYLSDMALDNICMIDNACSGQGGDSDGDGVCDNVDCEPNDPFYPATPGTPCNDGDSNTTNDVVTANGCDCQGTGPNLCNQISASVNGTTITVNNIYGANRIIKVWQGSNLQDECNTFQGDNCGATYTWSGQSNSSYYVSWQIFNAAGTLVCDGGANVTTGQGSCPNASTVFGTCESFETDFGIFSHVSGTKEWRRNQNGTTSNGTGPSGASDGNYYIYTEASGNGNGFPNVLFALESSCFLLNGFTNPALGFDYHMFGNNVGNLKIIVGEVGSNTPSTLFDLTGSQGDFWISTSVSLNSFIGKNIYIRIEGTSGSGWSSDIALDKLCLIEDSCSSQGGDTDGDGVCNNSDCQPNDPFYPATPGTPCDDGNANTTNDVVTANGCDCQGTSTGGNCSQTGPACSYDEDWEAGFGEWTNVSGDDFDWINKSGGTTSSGTGPSGAFSGSNYIYVEASSPNYPSKVTVLESSCFSIPNDNRNFRMEFYYHLYGANVGSIIMEASVDDVNWNQIWAKSGNQGDSWTGSYADLNAYKGQDVKIRITGTTGSNWSSDMALDKFELVCTSNGNDGPNQNKSVEPTAGIKDLKVYPNPVSDWLNVEFLSSAATTVHLEILSITGQQIFREKVETIDGENKWERDLSAIPEGIYLVRLSTGNRSQTFKLNILR